MDSHDEEIIEEDETVSDTVKKLREKLQSCQKEKQEYLDGWQRMKAEFVNFRKNEADGREAKMTKALEPLLRDVLGVLDSFDMALAAKTGAPGTDWHKGVEQIRTQLLSALSRHGVEPFDAKGESFDPSRHEPVGTVPPSDDAPDGSVAEVVQTGYTVRGAVFRPAIVKVAQG